MSQLRAIQDPLLTNVSSMLKPEGYISELIFPYVGVKESTGKLAKYGHSHLRVETTIAGGRGKFRRVEAIARSTTSYEIEAHGLEGMVTEEDYRNVQKPYDAERDETLGVSSILLTEKEFSLASVLADTGTVTQNVTLSGTSQFSDYDNSDPVKRFITAQNAIKDGCGKFPNAAWMDSRVANMLRFHPAILDFLGFKQNRPGGLTDQELATALNVKKVMIADGDYNSAKEGQSDTLASIWGKHIWFGVCPDSAQLQQVSAGYRFGIDGQPPRKVTKWAINNPDGATAILCVDKYDYVISNAGAIYLIKDAIA